MNGRALLALALALSAACARPSDKTEPAPQRGSAVPATTPPPGPAEKPGPAGKRAGKTDGSGKSPAAPGKPAASAAAPALDAGPPRLAPQEELKTEEPEANPFSESVTLKLAVTPPVKAVVLYGAKQLAHLEPGKMDAEITRPRGSGPVDVEVKADGYLPYHTRLYADRNDKLNVRLYRAEEAPNIFGYSRSAEAKKAAVEKEKAPKN